MEFFEEHDEFPEANSDLPHTNFKKRPQTSSDDVETPAWLMNYVLKEFPQITSDPCPLNPTQDGLQVDWEEWSYVNPPFSECQAWVEKAAAEASKGSFSVLLIPATFNSVYWRETVLPNASEIRIFSCPIKFDGQKKQVVTQMALVIFAAQFGNDGMPLISVIEPNGWQDQYYKRKRNRARFAANPPRRDPQGE